MQTTRTTLQPRRLEPWPSSCACPPQTSLSWPQEPDDRNVDRAAGQRVFTGLLYLTDEFDGGQTVFPALNLTVQPTRGTLRARLQPEPGVAAARVPSFASLIEFISAVFWRNLDFAFRPDPRTVHRANPVTGAGHKLAANLWVLERPFGLDTD